MKRNFILTGILAIAVCLPASATIINVPDDYETIQEGIDASTDGDTVLVQPGTYVENINFNGHNIVLGSLFLTTEDTSYISQTIIDGDSSGSVVTSEDGEDSTALVTGFLIKNGLGIHGGGIRILNSNTTIKNNIIESNVAEWFLGGHGGGIQCYNSSSLIEKNIIRDNYAESGAGIFCSGLGFSMIINNNIISNHSYSENFDASGGGIDCRSGSNTLICYNNISYNSADDPFGTAVGGGIYIHNSSPLIYGNIILNNTCELAAGIICGSSGISTIVNNILWSNFGDSIGGIWGRQENVILKNNIIRENTLPSFVDDTESSTVLYNNMEGGWEGEGNIDMNPLFRDPVNGDFHLMSTECGDTLDSPCIDAGHPDILDSLLDCSWGLGTILSDMGAYGGGDSVTVGIDDQVPDIPNRFALAQNYPNPFNASTVMKYSLSQDTYVTLSVYNVLGQRVSIPFEGLQQAGEHAILWDASDYPSGVYFACLKANGKSENIKMTLLR